MKIKVVEKSYEEVMALPQPKHEKPRRMGMFWRVPIKLLSSTNLLRYHVKYRESGMDRLGKDEPSLVLMNHSSFIDMQLVGDYWFPRPFSVVTTTDAYVGLAWALQCAQVELYPSAAIVGIDEAICVTTKAVHMAK